jgi:hypothetical protein
MQITQVEAVRKQNLISILLISKIVSADYNKVLSWQILPITVSAAYAGTHPEVDETHDQNVNAKLVIQGAHPLLPCPALAPFCPCIFLCKTPQSIPFFTTSAYPFPYFSAVSAAAFLSFHKSVPKAVFSIPLLAQFSSSKLSLTSASFDQE